LRNLNVVPKRQVNPASHLIRGTEIPRWKLREFNKKLTKDLLYVLMIMKKPKI